MKQPPATTTGPRDDRNQPVTLLNTRDLKRAEEDPSKRKAGLAKHLRHSIQAETKRFHWARFGVSIGLLAAFVMGYAVLTMFWRQAGILGCLPYLGAFIILTFIMRRWAIRGAARDLAVTAVAEGICGACAYSLESAPLASDGCVVCAECGAAWRAARIVRPHWKSPAAIQLYEPPWWKRTFLGFPRNRDQLAPDDRGRFVRILDSHLRLLSSQRRESLGADRILAVRADTRRVGRPFRVLIALIPALGAALLAWGAVAVLIDSLRVADRIVLGSILGFFTLVLLALAVGIYAGRAFAGPRKMTPIFRRHNLCGCCGLDLADLPNDSDGFATCPDCAAAWKFEARPQSSPVHADSP